MISFDPQFSAQVSGSSWCRDRLTSNYLREELPWEICAELSCKHTICCPWKILQFFLFGANAAGELLAAATELEPLAVSLTLPRLCWAWERAASPHSNWHPPCPTRNDQKNMETNEKCIIEYQDQPKKQPEMTLNCCCRLVSTIHSESPLSAAEGVNFSSKSGTSSTMMHMMHNYAARLVGTTFSATGEVLNSTHPAEIFLKRKLAVNIHQTPKTHACLTSLRLSLVLWSLTFFTFLKGKRAGVRRVSVNVAITT